VQSRPHEHLAHRVGGGGDLAEVRAEVRQARGVIAAARGQDAAARPRKASASWNVSSIPVGSMLKRPASSLCR
jgi:hypothetical protein